MAWVRSKEEERPNQVGEVLRRVEAGEALTVTVAGRTVAELHPTSRRRWASGAPLAAVWQGRTPTSTDADLAEPAADLTSPFAS